MIRTDIENTIHAYIRAWNARDFTAMAGHFTEPAVFIRASGTQALLTRAALEDFLRGVFEGLEAAGFDHTEIGAITTRECNDGLWLAEVADIRRFHRDGHLMETIEVQYSLRRDADGTLRMISALWCQQGWRERVL